MNNDPKTHRGGCPCCSPYVWKAFPPETKKLNRRGFFGMGAAVTAALLSAVEGARGRSGAGFAAGALSAAAFAAPAISGGGLRREALAGKTIYKGGLIRTMNEGQPVAEAVAVENGRIIAVGSAADVMGLSRGARIVDLDGRTMLPGFIDCHGHIAMTALTRAFCNLAPVPAGPVRSIEDIKRELVRHRDKMGGGRGGWILGANYDDSLLAERRTPTRADLDEISTEQPIFLMHASLHVGTANSKALEIAGISAETADPEGGVIRRWPDSREPNGMLEEVAMGLIMAKMPQTSLEELLDLLDGVQDQYAAWGITTAQDGATQVQDYKLLALAAERDRLKIDVVAYPFFLQAERMAASDLDMRRDYNGLKIGGIKLMMDGSPQAKTAWLTKPYHVPPAGQSADYRGYPTLGEEAVAGHVENAFARGWQVYAHCNGDAAADQFIDAIEKASAKHGAADRRTTIIHAQTLREDQLDRMQALGIVPSFFVTHTFYWGDWHRDSVLGPERGARISPTRSALSRGMRFTLHNDSPVAPSDPRMLLWSAVNRLTRSDRVLGEDQRIGVLDALRGITIDAAYQHFEDDIKGSIEPGKLADLVILGEDPLSVEPGALKNLAVLETIKRGEVIYSAG
ncbi:MAG: amidohydrolase [Parvibaculum sp.]|jgi:predicted amidohydrolase YtcJ|uniref:amidohydrolase n=1 Tax=Parvibaculum sp. TaxID=2024848 RepID=UPI00284B1120|nr:amidohydrolase [Parvibaculum sp.]MDR3498436.1 amidohydrolase [Parvibaculum sp.]